MGATVTPRAELSTIQTALDDLATRISAMAERAEGGDLDWLAGELFESERSLGEARRRVSRALERLR